MRLKEARELKPGDRVVARVDAPQGGESTWDPEWRVWRYEPVHAGDELEFQALIPKVRVIRYGAEHDSFDEMLFCRTLGGERAWLDISNAIRKEQVA